MLKALKVLIGILFALTTLLISALVYLNALRLVDFREQRTHIKELDTFYQSQNPYDEEAFMNFNLDSDIRLNEVRFIASHNSYKKELPKLGFLAIGLGQSFEDARSFQYEHNRLTEQLMDGVRSFELDLRYRQERYEVVHVPLVDHRSHAIDFQLALEEIRKFSEYNPDHLPITILIEVKDDWMILDPFLEPYNSEAFDVLDEVIETTLKSHLYRPSEMIHENKTLRETITEEGWPTVESLLGKIIVIKHPSQYTPMYVERDESLETLAMFPGVYANQLDSHYAAFVVHNTPDISVIQSMVLEGFIVRTRSDANLNIDLERKADAFLSGAQLITTDYYPNHNLLERTHVVVFENNKTMSKNTILITKP